MNRPAVGGSARPGARPAVGGLPRPDGLPRPPRRGATRPTLLGIHRAGDSAVHRVPAGAKLAGLAGLGLVVVLADGPVPAVAVLAATLALAATARLSPAPLLRAMRPALVTAAVAGLYQWWARDAATALATAAGLLALVLAAVVVTSTTPVDRMMDVAARLVRPLRGVGPTPETFALSVGLVLRTIPALATTVAEARDAARARGLDRSPRAWLSPTAVRTVRRARETGEALAARGLLD